MRERTESTITVRNVLVGAQMLLVAFGALVLVPTVAGLDANVALLTAGAGTLVFHVVTGFSVPVFLAGSFAFIAPVVVGIQAFGLPATLSGLVAAGVLYVVLAGVVQLRGAEVVARLLPPIVTGPVIMVIGVSLAPVAIDMATRHPADGAPWSAMLVAMVALAATVVTALLGRGLIKVLPVMVGAAVGYGVALPLGMVDFTPVANAAWLAVPAFVSPQFSWQAIVLVVPAALAPAIEHVGDIAAIRAVTGDDYFKKPGLARTLLGNGFAASFAGFMGGPPATTYSEVIGAVILTRVVNPIVMVIAAVLAIALSFIGKLGALLSTIPDAVMGGILVVLFGSIVAVGLASLVRARVNLSSSRNLIIAAVIMIFGVGNMVLSFGDFNVGGLGLAGIAGVLLNAVLPQDLGDTTPDASNL